MNKEQEEYGGSLGDPPNEKWQKFFNKCLEHSTLDIPIWKPAHLLGYFCAKYQQLYNTSYGFKFNSPSPTKSFEVFQVKKISQILSSDPRVLKEYIDWAFAKAEKEKRRFTSISFLTREEIVKEYKMTVLFAQKIDRSTPLPSNIKNYFVGCGEVNTYGDLAFLRLVSKTDSKSEVSQTFDQCLDVAKKNGFDERILMELK